LVIKCHPDKLDNTISDAKSKEYKEIYEDAIVANETEDWAKLIMVAMKLGVDIPTSAYDQIEAIEKSINKLKQKQHNIINSVAWNWYKSNDSTLKSDILKQHLDFMAAITKK
jgi:S-adenosylmethionine synthetase